MESEGRWGLEAVFVLFVVRGVVSLRERKRKEGRGWGSIAGSGWEDSMCFHVEMLLAAEEVIFGNMCFDWPFMEKGGKPMIEENERRKTGPLKTAKPSHQRNLRDTGKSTIPTSDPQTLVSRSLGGPDTRVRKKKRKNCGDHLSAYRKRTTPSCCALNPSCPWTPVCSFPPPSQRGRKEKRKRASAFALCFSAGGADYDNPR